VSDFNVLKGNYNSFGAYCIDAEGYVRPFEIEFYEEKSAMPNLKKNGSIQLSPKLQKGDCTRIRAETDLRHCNFKDANLENQNFYGVDISGVDLSGANLSNAILQRANLTGANLTGANLRSATFYKSTLVGAKLEDAIFGTTLLGDNEAYLDNVIDFKRYNVTDFTEADISNADFYYVKFVLRAIYDKTIAKGATFNGVNLNEDQRKALKKAGANLYYEDDEP
jgi:uncharacterized protein YjbI with pentapeptide repeats